MDYSQRAAYRQWWRDLPGIVHEESGLYLAQHAVDAVERQADTIRSMFSRSGRTHSPERLIAFRDAVHRAINRAALDSAGLDPAARRSARNGGPAQRADAGLRTGLITLRTQATNDHIAWRSGLGAVAPDIVPPYGPDDRNGSRHIPALLDLPGCEPRALLHAAATEAMIERLAAGPDGPIDPADVFEALHDPEGGWDAAARFAGASDPGEVALVADAMRGRYAQVDNINLTRKPFEPSYSRSQVSHYEAEVRKAQHLGQWAVSTGRATIADLAEQAAQAQVRPAVLDTRAGLTDPSAEAPPSPPASRTTYGQGREQVDRGR